MAALLASQACSKGSSDSSDASEASDASESTETGSLVTTIVAALEVPRITTNNPWSDATADYENAFWCLDAVCGVWSYLGYFGHPYTTWKADYEAKLDECESYGEDEVEGERVCVPTSDTGFDCATSSMLEYGWYCGAGRPAPGYWGKEPLDGVDYCCYLHDNRVWDERDAPSNIAIERNLACGMALCLYHQMEHPAGAASAFPEVQTARQCIYDWAALGCTFDQSNDPPGPVERLRPTLN
jgi:hypothetical protein